MKHIHRLLSGSATLIAAGLIASSFTLMVVADGTDTDNHKHRDPILLAQVTPEEEKKLAAQMKAVGPAKTTGIENVRVMGTVPLKGQFNDVDSRQLRARELDIAPGGVVAVHQHDGRPGVAYIVSGQLTEHRVGADGAVTKYAGDTALEMTGTTHWWENEGGTSARVIVVDIVPVE